MCDSQDVWHYNAQAVGQEEYNQNEIIQILTDAILRQQVCSISPSETNVSQNSIHYLKLFFDFGICTHSTH